MPQGRQLGDRVCLACGARLHDEGFAADWRVTCLHAPALAPETLPKACWRRSAHPFGESILKTIIAFRSKGSLTRRAHENRLKLAKELWELSAQGAPTPEQLTDWIKGRDTGVFRRLLETLDPTSDLAQCISAEVTRVCHVKYLASKREQNRRGRERYVKQERPPPVVFPLQIEEGLRHFDERICRRREVRVARGHTYAEATLVRNRKAARRFCIFVTEQGHQFWQQVSQLDLDLFVASANAGAAAHAWMFLQTIRPHFRLQQKLIRPRVRRSPLRETVADFRLTPERLKKLVAHKAPATVLAGLFLMLYGQTVTRSHQLRLRSFRCEGGQWFACFAEDWVPLDRLSTRYLLLVAPELATGPIIETEDRPLLAPKRLHMDVYQLQRLTGAKLKPLRLAALAYVIRSGVWDRAGLERALGFSSVTITSVERLFESDLHITVPEAVVADRNAVFRGEHG